MGFSSGLEENPRGECAKGEKERIDVHVRLSERGSGGGGKEVRSWRGGSKGRREVREGSLVHSPMLTNVKEEEDGTRTLDLGTG